MNRSKLNHALIASLCLSVTILVFAPFRLFLKNLDSFPFFPIDILLFVLPLALLQAAALTLALFLLKDTPHKIAVSLILVTAILLWVEGCVVNWPYGLLDGRAIDWSAFRVRNLIDSFMWLTLLAVAILKAPFIYRKTKTIAAILMLTQGVSTLLAFSVLDMTWIIRNESTKMIKADKSVKFLYSNNENVIILVLDSFQSNYFQQIIDEKPEYKDAFDGFIYFRNSLTAFEYSFPAVPALLTGAFYDNSEPRWDFLRRTFLENSLPQVLKEHGYAVNCFPKDLVSYVCPDPRLYDNLTHGWFSDITKQRWLSYLLDLSLFRFFPQALKRYIYTHEQRFELKMHPTKGPSAESQIFEGRKFLDDATGKLSDGAQKKSFFFYYLTGLHDPLHTASEDLTYYPELPSTKAAYIGAAKAWLRVCKEFFDLLKQKGLYDRSMIIVTADHGHGFLEDTQIDPATDAKSRALDRQSPEGHFQVDKSRAIPLLLIKRIGSKGALTTSDAPVSLMDLPKTITSELGIDSRLPGVSVFSLTDQSDRVRYYGAFTNNSYLSYYLNPITVYAVRGFSWSNDSWEFKEVLPPAPSAKKS